MQPSTRLLQITGEPEYIRQACDFVTRFVADQGLDDDTAYRCELAVDEVLTNIIEHGYKFEGANSRIDIEVQRLNHGLQIRIVDDAPPFNPLNQVNPDPQAPLNERSKGGWGIYFVKKYMNQVRYELIQGRNNLIMTMNAPIDCASNH
ncbi:hypothetical protein MASR2M15_24650 [Anaerolineales bacterium]